MTTFAILGTGESFSQELADFVRGKCGAIAVSDNYKLAPWADGLVSSDGLWWKCNPQALQFAGRKFCSVAIGHKSVEVLKPDGPYSPASNSGLRGMVVAEKIFGATRLLLLGFDMRGSHYFGPHPEPLNNTSPERFKVHMGQFRRWNGCQVLNCTKGSALQCFPFMDIREALLLP